MAEKNDPAVAQRKIATIRDVAERAGVSRSAVSRSFTPGAYVSPKTREKIRAASLALGYRPNLVARSLSTRRSQLIGVAITRLVNSFHAELLQGLSVGLEESGHRILLFMTDPLSDADPPIDDVLRHKVDALILCAVRLSSGFAAECEAAGVPVVLLNRTTEGTHVSTIVGDNANGGRTIGAFLLAAEHRRPAFVSGFEDSSTSRERERGFCDYLSSQGFTPLRAAGNFDSQCAAEACRELLRRSDPPDAIFCANDHMALAVMDVARREYNADIGRHLSVIGFDNSLAARNAGIDLTSYSQDAPQMVGHAVKTVRELLGDPQASPIHVRVPGDLVVRSSARQPVTGVRLVDGVKIWRPEPQ